MWGNRCDRCLRNVAQRTLAGEVSRQRWARATNAVQSTRNLLMGRTSRFRDMFGRLLRAEGQSRAAKTVEMFG